MKLTRRVEYGIVGQVVRNVREDRRLSQRSLAAKLGRPQSAIAKIESGDQGLDIVDLLDLASALGMSASELVALVEAQLPGIGDR